MRGSSFLLGFALGGFIDGILLHQVLQWHHLLSNVDRVRDLRTQILADGLFHVLMYMLVVVALVRLGRAWKQGSVPPPGALLVPVLYGFAAWQAVDIVGFHWLVGIHRVRVDVPNPLFWDVAWLVAFGLPPLLAAWALRRRPPGGGARTTAAALAAATVAAGTWAAWPNDAQAGSDLVVFAPGTSPAAAFDALARQDARVRWVDASGGVWAVEWTRSPSGWELLRDGAVLAGDTAIGLGCVGWIADGPPAVSGAARP